MWLVNMLYIKTARLFSINTKMYIKLNSIQARGDTTRIHALVCSGVRAVHCVPIKLTATITEILLKVALYPYTPNPGILFDLTM